MQALGSRPPDGPRELGKRVSQLDTGGGRYLLGDGHGTVARDGDPFDREFGVEQPRCELLCADPGHSVAGWVLSSIWLCTSKAVSLSRAIRARMRRRRRSSSRPARTVSAAVSTTIAIRARSERIVARSTLSGRSGST
ncbi:hypothetical protein I551_1144 [Mycobacterium ulcerans str. Harvey]|uniref:Uncharacterized protein n=1 Tax=Mycobacterium ulcerans str. Harvey TaxID=1299332 RepID=A0ABN0R5T2_MYCUL|nr:hypothetical protein I551_1144 [Mycobacterium ulcerans str. Harvey]